MSSIRIDQTDTELRFTQTLAAPRELVFQAFSDATHVQKWWTPAPGWTTPVCTIDFRVGGEWRYCFQSPEGEQHWAKSVYKSIKPPEEISFIDGITDPSGNLIEGLPSKHTTITFAEGDGKTTLSIRVKLASKTEKDQLAAMGFVSGFTTTLNQLSLYIVSISNKETK